MVYNVNLNILEIFKFSMDGAFNIEVLFIMLGYAVLNGFGSLLFKIHFKEHQDDNQESLLKLDKNLLKTLWKLIKDWKWTLGEILLLLDFVVYQFALSRYEISVVKPLVNLNLIFVITFGVIFMKEKITKREIIALIFIIIGSVAITYYSVETETVPNLYILFVFTALVFTLVFIGVFCVQRKSGEKNYEYFISLFSGGLYGLGAIFNKSLYQEVYNPQLFFIIFLILFAISYFIAFTFGQFAYSEGRMSMVSTIVNIISILIPFVGGILIFGENFIILLNGEMQFPGSYMKLIGFTLIIIGVLLAYNPKKDEMNSKWKKYEKND